MSCPFHFPKIVATQMFSSCPLFARSRRSELDRKAIVGIRHHGMSHHELPAERGHQALEQGAVAMTAAPAGHHLAVVIAVHLQEVAAVTTAAHLQGGVMTAAADGDLG